MARMSIDDKFLRDPRVAQLALDLKMSVWEARGRLLAVFSACYDLERDVLTCNQVDLAAELPGFGDAMFAVDLAVNVRGGMRIRGAGERIKYLNHKVEAGRIGGLKSGETRKNRAKQNRSRPEARGNPPDPVPDLVPDPVPEDQNSPSARAIQPAVPQPEPTPVPAVSPPAPAREDIARTHGAECPSQTANGQIRPFLPPAVEATLRANPPPAPSAPFDPADPRALGRLGDATYRRVSDARIAMAAELKLPAPIPFPAITPSSETRGLTELRARIREEGALAPAACDRVVANLIAQARTKRSLDWLSERAFGDKAWTNARDGVDPSARSAIPRSGRPEQPSTPQPPRFTPTVDPVVSAEDRAEMLALRDRLNANPSAAAAALLASGEIPKHMPAAALHKLYGDGQRAPPASAGPHDDTTDENHRRRKAAK
jgi:hypothetical protein